MTHKQKNIQSSLPRPSIDGVDNAAELYRQFDTELGHLLDEDDDVFDMLDDRGIENQQSDDGAYGNDDTSNVPSYYKDFDQGKDAEEYIKDDHLNIQFQGEKEKRIENTIGSRQYSDSSNARDAVLSAYTADIRKEEAIARIARHPDKFTPVVDERVVAHDTMRSKARTVAQKTTFDTEITAQQSSEEVNTPPINDLDTGASLGGRAALLSELATTQEASKKKSQKFQKPRDVVRLGTIKNVQIVNPRIHKQRHVSKSTSLCAQVPVTYRQKPCIQKQKEKQQKQNVSRKTKEKSSVQPFVKVRPSAPLQPPLYQLGRTISPQHIQKSAVVASQYIPQNTSQVIDPATPLAKDREGIVAFFDHEKKEQLQRSDGRAHASMGSRAFVQKTPKRSFAEIADRVRRNQTDRDAADFLDKGKITFTNTTKREVSENKKEQKNDSGIKDEITFAKSQKVVIQEKVQKKQRENQREEQKKKEIHKKQIHTQSVKKEKLAPVVIAPRQRKTLKICAVTKRPQRIGTALHTKKQLPQKSVQVQPMQSIEIQKQNTPNEVTQLKNTLQKQAQKRLQLRIKPQKIQVQQSKKKALLRKPSKHVRAQSASQKPQKKEQIKKRVVLKQKQPSKRRRTTLITLLVIAVALIIFGMALVQRGSEVYTSVKNAAERGFGSLQNAVIDVKGQDFVTAQESFQNASYELDRADASFAQINSGVIAIAQYIPFLSKVASGKSVIDVGQHIARAGTSLSKAGQALKGIGNPLSGETVLLNTYQIFAAHVNDAQTELIAAQESVDRISVADIPSKQRDQFVQLKEKLPVILTALTHFQESNHVIADLLGANGPRKYLFLFQNNHEIRATGGFIGSYGRLDISNGTVKQFFIDGIFNPNGQLFEKVIPPRPIQKISAAWSLHDSNWFPHFPTSAEKAIVFYERTGGPTVDGVIAITPIVLERLLAVTGPVHLPDYDTDITADNFMERLQQEVEIDYDKAENKPKKILSDLAPIILSRIFATTDGGDLRTVLDVMGQMLVQKHIQLYARNNDVQGWISTAGWGGLIADVPYDYLNVINTNINGFKTDGVVDETIYHWADIQRDGSIIDTVRIVRKHNGGHTPYEWWNKVNANYMRVFVPHGAKLISVSGQTREFVEPPLDYHALGFQSDARVVKEEQSMTIDDATGTRIYEQNNKTIFANWVYVSPQETVTIEYSYKLPFQLQIANAGSADTYSILFQKQAGSTGSHLISQINLPENMQQVWSHPQNMGDAQWETTLVTDQLRGVVVTSASQ